MADKFHHEAIYRGAGELAKFARQRVTVCGAGALGSHLADNLARQGFRHLRVIDRDRVEVHNVSTQLYGESEVGAWKVEALRQRLFRATGIEIVAQRKDLTDRTARPLLSDTDLVIDAFDNSASRRVVQENCRALQLPCLHVGLYADYGEVIWDEKYRVPQDVAGDVCDYPLARNVILLVVAVASEIIMQSVLTGSSQSCTVTMRDFSIRPLES
jgi:molybdopterin-synthase adenylyltransferase